MGDPRTTAQRRRLMTMNPRNRGRRGAALIIVIAIMTILLAIALTFFTNANIEVGISLNVENTARVGFIQDAATAIAQASLNQDLVHNASATSLDHPWRSLYSGTAFAGKPWARYRGQGMGMNNDGTRQPGMPEFNLSGLDGIYIKFQDGIVEPLFQGSRSKQWLFIPRYQGPSSTTGGRNALVLYDCVKLVDENGEDVANSVADYLTYLNDLNTQLAPRGFYLAYYSGLDTDACLRDQFGAQGFAALPKVTDNDVPFVTSAVFGRVLDADGNPVFDITDDDAQQYPTEQVANFADVDNDGDGKTDSIWIPIPIDLYFTDDGVDNNLSGWTDEQQDNGLNDDGNVEAGDMVINDALVYYQGDDTTPKAFNDPDEAIESAVFAYYAGDDGLDNDGDGIVDDADPDENGSGPNRGLFLTAPLPGVSFYLDLNADGVAYDLVPDEATYQGRISAGDSPAQALAASLKPLRMILPPVVRVLKDGVAVELGAQNVDTIDNDYDLVVNDYSAYCYVGPNTLPGNFRPPFEAFFDTSGYFITTASDDTFNSYLSIYDQNNPATAIWQVTTLPPDGYYATWRAPGNWFQPVPTPLQLTTDANGARTFADVARVIGDPVLFSKARKKAFIEINGGAFDINADGAPDYSFSPRIVHLRAASGSPDGSLDLNNQDEFMSAIHVTSSGEPVCELAGRAAILINDEASKVNLNVAGAFTYNDEYPNAIDGTAVPFRTGPLARASLGEGASPAEWETRMLPGLDEVGAAAIAAGRLGSPDQGAGLAVHGQGGSRPDVPNAPKMFGNPASDYAEAISPNAGLDYSFDAGLPGYGRVDDNADALLRALNGGDDDGDGLIDEGLYLPALSRYPLTTGTATGYFAFYPFYTYSTYDAPLSGDAIDLLAYGETLAGDTPGSIDTDADGGDAYAWNLREEIRRYLRYANRLGNLEGIDDPAEFQITAALRNIAAERDSTNNNATNGNTGTGTIDEAGELGDRVYTDINVEELAQRTGLGQAAIRRVQRLVTAFSSDRNSRFVTTADGALRALNRIDYNYATPQQLAATLLLQGDFHSSATRTIDDADGNEQRQVGKRFVDNNDIVYNTNAYYGGLRVAGVNRRAPDPTSDPLSTPGFVNYWPDHRGDAVTGGVMFVRESPTSSGFLPTTSGPAHEIPSDALLDALQLAVNIVDNTDRDHLPHRLTMENYDTTSTTAEADTFVSWPTETSLNARERIPVDQLLPTEKIGNYLTNVLDLLPKTIQAVDTWWAQYVAGAANPSGQRRAEQRHFSYTAAGSEAIKINELMVRPTRRVETEMIRASVLDKSVGEVEFLDVGELIAQEPYDPFVVADPSAVPSAFVGNLDTVRFDPAPAFDLNQDLDFESDPLPDFDLTRQDFLSLIDRSARFDLADPSQVNLTWLPQFDTTRPVTLGDEVSIGITETTPSTQVVDRSDNVQFEVSDIVQFIVRGPQYDPEDPFSQPAGLPAGRYYLTVNTTDPDGAVTVLDGDALQYSIKYVPVASIKIDKGSNDITTDGTILGDIYQRLNTAASNVDPIYADFVRDHFVNVPAAHVAGSDVPSSTTYGEGRVPGWVFLDGTPAGVFEPGYFADGGGPGLLAAPASGATHTVVVPPYSPGNTGYALCIAFRRNPNYVGPNSRISLNFLDFQQQPDHEYIELTNTSQDAVALDGWKLEVGIPMPPAVPDFTDDDPHKSIWQIPAGTTIAPGGTLLLGFDVFDGFQEDQGAAYRKLDSAPTAAPGDYLPVFNVIGHNGMGLAGWDGAPADQPYGPNVANVTTPNFRDVSYLENTPANAIYEYQDMFAPLGRFYDPTGSVFRRGTDDRFRDPGDDSILNMAIDYVDRDGDGLSSFFLAAQSPVLRLDGFAFPPIGVSPLDFAGNPAQNDFPSLNKTFAELNGAGMTRQALRTIDAVADDALLENEAIISTQPPALTRQLLANQYAIANQPAYLVNTSEADDRSPNKPWDRIVQLTCIQTRRDNDNSGFHSGGFTAPMYSNGRSRNLENVYGATEVDDIADLVLRGGFLPDYPEHDGHDNDGDGAYLLRKTLCEESDPLLEDGFPFDYVPGTLDKDMIDNDLNGVIDERGVGYELPDSTGDTDDCIYPGTVGAGDEILPDPTRSEGVDEGNLFQPISESVFLASGLRNSIIANRDENPRRYGVGSFEAGLLPAVFLNNRGLYTSLAESQFQVDSETLDTDQGDTLVEPIFENDVDPNLGFRGIPEAYIAIPARTELSFADNPAGSGAVLITRLGASEIDPISGRGHNFDSSVALPDNFNEAYYLGSDLDPPTWKAFTERRWNPGDNVIVSLYNADETPTLVDRVTYREYDVINRTIDDVAPCPYIANDDGDNKLDEVDEFRLSLFPATTAASELAGLNPAIMPVDAANAGYPTVWRPNHMGLDFYRSLERKDPNYPGDLFGTSNRWEPTDGNYDDWAESMPYFVQLMQTNPGYPGGQSSMPVQLAKILEMFPDPTAASGSPRADVTEPFDGHAQDATRLFRHAMQGSPLRMNTVTRLLRNPADLIKLSMNEDGSRFPGSYSVDEFFGGTQLPNSTNRRPYGQYRTLEAQLSYSKNPFDAPYTDDSNPFEQVQDNRDWTMSKLAGADRYTHRDIPLNLQDLNDGTTDPDDNKYLEVLKAGSADENLGLRGMDQPLRSDADLMRVPFLTVRHDMFNYGLIKEFLGSDYDGDAFIHTQDPLGYEVNFPQFRFPSQLQAAVLGADDTDLDPARMWAKAAQPAVDDMTFGRDPADQNRTAPFTETVESMATQPVVLTVGQATFIPIAPARFELDADTSRYPAGITNYTQLVNWNLDNPADPLMVPPVGWSPVFLYELPDDDTTNAALLPLRNDALPFYPAYPNGATSGVFVNRHYLFSTEYLFPSGPGGASYFTGRSRNTSGLGDIPNYGVTPASLDLKATGAARRAPFEQRAAMYVACNRTGLNQYDRGDAVFTWDENDGLENGEYVIYVGTWLPGLRQRVRQADTAVENAEDGNIFADQFQPGNDVPFTNATLDPDLVGDNDLAIRSLLALEPPTVDSEGSTTSRRWDPHLRMEFITERTRAKGITPMQDPPENCIPASAEGLLPPACWQPSVEYIADSNGYVFYASEAQGAWQPIVVRVTDNFLALRVRNTGDHLQAAAISHVVLTPHKRAAGKININTTQLAQADNISNKTVFSSLLGLPGIYNDAEPVGPYLDNVSPPTGNPPNTKQDAAPVFYTQGQPVPPLPDPVIDDANPLAGGNQDRSVQLAGLVQAGRTVHADGRYYTSPGDLVRSDTAYNYRPSDGGSTVPDDPTDNGSASNPTAETLPLYALSNRGNDEERFDETARRFRRLANSVTVRSDVFEIIATVQAGYGIDANNDGRLNYRSPDEFVTTAESKGRVVYERRAPSDNSDQSGG